MLTTEQAHKIGIVDEVVPADQVEARAQEEVKSWIRIPGKFFTWDGGGVGVVPTNQVQAQTQEEIKSWIKIPG